MVMSIQGDCMLNVKLRYPEVLLDNLITNVNSFSVNKTFSDDRRECSLSRAIRDSSLGVLNYLKLWHIVVPKKEKSEMLKNKIHMLRLQKKILRGYRKTSTLKTKV
nr:hypothetical protein 1634Bnrm1_p105 [Cryptomonas sp.]